MRYRVTMSISIEARDEREAYAHATKLGELLESPMVRMAVQGQGIRLPSDVQAIVYQPQREI